MRDGLGPGRLVMEYDMASFQTVPCHIAGKYAGIVLLEEKIVSNNLINWQDMWANYYAN